MPDSSEVIVFKERKLAKVVIALHAVNDSLLQGSLNNGQ